MEMKRAVARLVKASNYVMFWVRRWVLARRYLRGDGLEIGAMDLPMRISSRARVRYVDRLDDAGLRRHYPETVGKKLVQVDVVDDVETLATQADESVDFIIANHVIEHTEDPLGTIESCLRVIRVGGILYLGVPDRRLTFDVDRPGTELEHLIRDHAEGTSLSREMHLEEWARFVLKTPPDRLTDCMRELEERKYSIHFHTWDKGAFREMLEYARHVANPPFDVEMMRQNAHEFIAVLRRR